MSGTDLEHRTEIRRANRTTPIWVALALLGAALVLVLGGRDGSGDDDAIDPPTSVPATPTSETLTTTQPAALPVVHVVADTGQGPRPATTVEGPDPSAVSAAVDFEALQAPPIVTDGHIVVLVDGGTVLAGRPGTGFEPVEVGGPAAALVASNEPAHVWVRTPDDELALIGLDGSEAPVRIPLEGDRVLGPASFGVVTVGQDGTISWRRPSFDPTPVGIGGEHVAVDAGGDVVLVEGPEAPGGGRRFEVWSVVDGSFLRMFGADGGGRPAVLATDGSTVALPNDAGWSVLDIATGDRLGLLPTAPGEPVWIGDARFAVLVDGAVVVSDGSQLAPRWRLRALAEQSP